MEWIFFRALEAGAVDPSAQILWAKFEYFGIVCTGVAWLCFALDYIGNTWWRRPGNLLLLGIFPLVTLIMVWTNQWHGWYWSNIYALSGTSGTVLVWEHGPWFWAQVAFQYTLFITGIYLLWRFAILRPTIYRRQIVALFIGTLIPLLGNVIYILGYSPLQELDLMPLVFVIGGLLYAVSIFRFHLLDVIPLARSALIENMADGVIVLNTRGSIIDMNPAAERMAGFSKASAQSKGLDQLWPELARITSIPGPGHQEELISAASGNNLYYDFNLTNLPGKNGADFGKLVVLRDITERKLTHQKLELLYHEEQKLRNDLQEEIDNRSKYVRAIVHELKTPLTAIISSSDLLQEEVHDPVLSAVAANVWRASINLEKRINELIELARGEIGMLKINPEPLDISQLIQNVVSEMTPIAAVKGLSMISDVPKIPLVQGDGDRLRQVMINLLGNAIKFTEKGEILITLSNFESQSALIQIKDTGRGIKREQMEFLFDPYRRKVTYEKLSGLGIGLALSKIKCWLSFTRVKSGPKAFPAREAPSASSFP